MGLMFGGAAILLVGIIVGFVFAMAVATTVKKEEDGG